MHFNTRASLISACAVMFSLGRLAGAQSVGAKVYETVSPSLVAVQYVWENEAQRREITVAAVVISSSDKGTTVMMPAMGVPMQLPDAQLKEFKVIVPKVDTDHEELEAEFLGRDERNQVAFVKIKDASKKLPAVNFVEKPWTVGDAVYSVGILPKASGYKSYLTVGTAAAKLRGETKVVMTTGELAGAGSVVFNAAGDAAGFVLPHDGAFFWLEPRNPRQEADNPKYFVGTEEIAGGLKSIPTEPNKYDPIPFTGIAAMNGLSKDLSEVFGLTGKAAVEIGDVIPGTPAAAAGLEKGQIITEVDGQALERGDEPEELGGILGKKILKKKVGDVMEFTVLTKRGEPAKKVKVTLSERPAQMNTAARFHAEDLGYAVRDAVLGDFYRRKLIGQDGKTTTPGVVVAFIKPSSSAAAARLAMEDLITQLNGQPVADSAAFKVAYDTARKEKPKDALVLQVVREGATQVIRIDPPQ